jgi:hypothetical protein
VQAVWFKCYNRARRKDFQGNGNQGEGRAGPSGSVNDAERATQLKVWNPRGVQVVNAERVIGMNGAGGVSVTAFHTAEWAQVLHETYGHRPLYLAIGEPGRISALLPLMEVASPFTGRRGVSLPFTDSCSVLEVSPGVAGPLYQRALELGKERGWRYLECRCQCPGWAGATPSVSFL